MRLILQLLGAVVLALALALPWLTTIDLTADSDMEPEATTGLPAVPVVPVRTSVPDFDEIADVRAKKQAFFEYLMPAVKAENARITRQRAQLVSLIPAINAGSLTVEDEQWLRQLADQYNIDYDETPTNDLTVLLKRRVDTIPESLVLVQAANESGWGTSRFARQGLNFFGQWCYRKGCGLVPDDRIEDGRHEVAKFQSMNASVRSYLRNINTHPAYLELRQIRESHRQQGEPVSSTDLTQGLLSYSERREAYIEELNAMIRVNRPLIQEISSVNLN